MLHFLNTKMGKAILSKGWLKFKIYDLTKNAYANLVEVISVQNLDWFKLKLVSEKLLSK